MDGLGPISVDPYKQGLGIGLKLMRIALKNLKQSGANGCVLLGEPKYYSRFGFRSYPNLILPDVPQMYFQAVSFIDHIPDGIVTYHESFSATD